MAVIFIPSEWQSSSSTYSSVSDLTENLNANNFQIINLKNPTLPNDAVNKASAEEMIKDTCVLKNRDIDMSNKKIKNLAGPEVAGDAVNKRYLDHVCGAFLNKNSVINMNDKRIVNLGKAVDKNDAASKSYVDDVIKGAVDASSKPSTERDICPLFYGFVICTPEPSILSFTDITRTTAKLNSLKISKKGLHNIRVWVQIFSDEIETVSVKLVKNEEEFPVLQKVFYKINGDHDSYYSGLVDFEKDDSLSFFMAANNAISVHYFIELEHRGFLPEIVSAK
jgi:hypothetical protein